MHRSHSNALISALLFSSLIGLPPYVVPASAEVAVAASAAPPPTVIPPESTSVAPPAPAQPTIVHVPSTIRPLPGGLDKTLVLNSNSPEIVQSEGILVSTLSPAGKATPSAHLNVGFEKRFDVFLHHIAKSDTSDLTTMYVAVLLQNPNKHDAHVRVLEAASYLSQPDAPFGTLADFIENPESRVYAGPGDRVTNDILRHELQSGWPQTITVPAGQSAVLISLPIPIKGLMIPLNGRSLLAKLETDRKIHAATLAMYAKKNASGEERPPTDSEWKDLLVNGSLAGPREKPASVPGAGGPFSYGRVAGVAEGAEWTAPVTDAPGANHLSIGQRGLSVSFPISTVVRGTFGTNQVQAAPLIAREPDTAYAAHGNYGVRYLLEIPLNNDSDEARTVALTFSTPLKTDAASVALAFNSEPSSKVWYRGTVQIDYTDENEQAQRKFIHIVEHQGQQGQPLLSVCVKPRTHKQVTLQLVYPPDATPPQMVTISTY